MAFRRNECRFRPVDHSSGGSVALPSMPNRPVRHAPFNRRRRRVLHLCLLSLLYRHSRHIPAPVITSTLPPMVCLRQSDSAMKDVGRPIFVSIGKFPDELTRVVNSGLVYGLSAGSGRRLGVNWCKTGRTLVVWVELA